MLMIVSSSTIMITKAKQDHPCLDSLLKQVLVFPKNFMRIYKY